MWGVLQRLEKPVVGADSRLSPALCPSCYFSSTQLVPACGHHWMETQLVEMSIALWASMDRCQVTPAEDLAQYLPRR